MYLTYSGSVWSRSIKPSIALCFDGTQSKPRVSQRPAACLLLCPGPDIHRRLLMQVTHQERRL